MFPITSNTAAALLFLAATVSATPLEQRDGKFPCAKDEIGIGNSEMCSPIQYGGVAGKNSCGGKFPSLFNNGGKNSPASFIGDPTSYCNPKWQHGWKTECDGTSPTKVTDPKGVVYGKCKKNSAGWIDSIAISYSNNHVDWCCSK